MTRCKLVLGLIACLSISLLVSRTLSQTRGGFGGGGGFGRPQMGPQNSSGIRRSTTRETTDKSKEASLKGAVGATDEQWAVIKPKLEKVRQLQRIACIGIMIQGGSSGGGSRSLQSRASTATGPIHTDVTSDTKQQSRWMRWKWYRSWGSQPPQRDAEKLCDALFNLLKSGNADPGEIRQNMNALSKTREQRKEELAKARKELRELLTLDQEARLVALGWLD